MATYKSMSSLKDALRKSLVPAVNIMSEKIEKKIDEKVMEYYQEYSPIDYDRTGAMSNVPQRTNATGSGNIVNAKVEADLSHNYSTGNWNMPEVWDSANNYLHGGLNVGNGVAVWDEPINESKNNSQSMWADSLKAAGIPVK